MSYIETAKAVVALCVATSDDCDCAADEEHAPLKVGDFAEKLALLRANDDEELEDEYAVSVCVCVCVCVCLSSITISNRGV